MLIPTACAAAGSSRVARRTRPNRLRWYANAAAMTSDAPIVACAGPVVCGTSESVVAPGPMRVHSRRTLLVISSTANVAMPAASPERRISGSPAIAASSAANGGGERERLDVPELVVAEQWEHVAQDRALQQDRHGEEARGEGADGHEADLPEGEHAGVADEDVEGDDDRHRDDRLQHVDLRRPRDDGREQPGGDDEQHGPRQLHRPGRAASHALHRARPPAARTAHPGAGAARRSRA